MVLMDMSFVAGVIIRQRVFFSLAPATALGLCSTKPVCTATFGRLFRTRSTTTHGTSTLIRGATARTTTFAAAGGLFALFKVLPNSVCSWLIIA